MKELSVSEFKQKCLRLLTNETLKESSLSISRRGKIVAIVSSPSSSNEETTLKGSVQFLKKDWESAKFTDEWVL